MRIAELATELQTRAGAGGRYLVGITGIPGSGKSTLAGALAAELNSAADRALAASVPMDGFHRSNAELRALGLSDYKGCPASFDAHRFVRALHALRDCSDRNVMCPEYSRTIHEPIADAIVVTPDTRIVIIEGLYLLYDQPPWHTIRELLDSVWYIDIAAAHAMQRLRLRHRAFGRSPAETERRIAQNDRVNACTVEATRERADGLIQFTLDDVARS
ncbi:MAG: nucleoside/nucleotide kinase family protein [Spirochaetaceae bacterium]|nr:MAG: nucleoside/nucleotide kinase family protein [Spirochaetaceae bacterium]